MCGVMNCFLAANEQENDNYASDSKPAQQYMSMGAYTAYPYSRGSIHITSKDKTADGYEFDGGFLSHPLDLKTQLWGYKVTRRIARSLTYVTGEVKYAHPSFADNSDARAMEILNCPTLEDPTYTAEDDAVIEDWIRENLSTTWHSLGTCAMRERSKGGVVDKNLNVYGTRALKVADLSIVPENVGANTNNTAFAVGEKAAIIIGKELEGALGRQVRL
jgi:alcohol oxidase